MADTGKWSPDLVGKALKKEKHDYNETQHAKEEAGKDADKKIHQTAKKKNKMHTYGEDAMKKD